jgi:hypothetical protein
VAFIDKQHVDAVASANEPMAMEDIRSGEKAASLELTENNELVQFIYSRFTRSKDARITEEGRWLDAFRNYRGIYGPGVEFTDHEKCKIFLRVTKVKVLAAFGQLTDVLFAGGGKMPIGIQHTPVPEGVAEAVHFDEKAPPTEAGQVQNPDAEEGSSAPDPYGFEGDGRSIPPGATAANIMDLLGPMKADLEQIPGLKEGPGLTPSAVTFHPAKVAAQRMEKKIADQMDECDADKHLRSALFEMCLLGTGVISGPFSYQKEYPRWTEDGTYDPIIKLVPRIEACSIWDFYPDPDATILSDAEFTIRRRKLSRSQMRGLKKRPFFRGNVIDACIEDGPNYHAEYWEDVLRDSTISTEGDRWEVLEWWGTMDADMAEQAGIEIPAEMRDHEEVQVNAWICGGRVLRVVLNPFTPSRLPFVAIPFELNPYSIFGTGVAENMADSQQVLNASFRMAVDNAALSGNLVFEVDETNLVPGQDLRLHPGKILRRQGGAPGQSLFAQKFPNTTQENLMMFDKARQLADESTGIPSFAHGQTGVTGVGRTAAGISMLMGASSINIKTVVRNVDDYCLLALGRALFAWNMQFSFDPKIVGDLEIVARGTASLLKNEVRQQRLMTFLQLGANPALAPFIKFQYIIREVASVLDLDPDQVCNTPEEAQRQAAMMKLSQPEPSVTEGGNSPAVGTDTTDPTGAGNGSMGVGSVPTPGEAGFSGGPPPNGPMPQMGMQA